MMRDLYQNHERFEETYFKPFPVSMADRRLYMISTTSVDVLA